MQVDVVRPVLCYEAIVATCQLVVQAWTVWPCKHATILSVILCFEPHQRTLNQPIAPNWCLCSVTVVQLQCQLYHDIHITSWTVVYEQLCYILLSCETVSRRTEKKQTNKQTKKNNKKKKTKNKWPLHGQDLSYSVSVSVYLWVCYRCYRVHV